MLYTEEHPVGMASCAQGAGKINLATYWQKAVAYLDASDFCGTRSLQQDVLRHPHAGITLALTPCLTTHVNQCMPLFNQLPHVVLAGGCSASCTRKGWCTRA